MQQHSQVLKYVLYRCRENNTPLTQVMASFLIQTIFNPKTQRFYLEDRLAQSEIKELKELALAKVFEREGLELKIIAMQITYDTEYLQAEMTKQAQQQNASSLSESKIDDIVAYQIKSSKDFEGLSQLYKRIFNFLLIKNRQIMPADRYAELAPKIEKEVTAALESVIPRAALGPFVTLNSNEKVTQLIQLSNLVIGIRLFNQEVGKGGAGLVQVHTLVDDQLKNSISQAYVDLDEIAVQCERYTSVFLAEQKELIQLQPNQFRRFKHQTAFIRQYRSLLIALNQQLQSSSMIFDSNLAKYERQMSDLKTLLGSKSTAPKDQVYPRFALLAQAYSAVVEEGRILVHRLRLFRLLKQYRKGFPLSLLQKTVIRAQDLLQKAPEDSIKDIEEDPNSGVQVQVQPASPDFMPKADDYLGFCLWSIVHKQGLLIPGTAQFGVYRYKDKSCVFSSVKAVNDFIKKPEVYINGVINQCRKNPQLIHFLNLEDSFRNVKLSLVKQAVEGGIKNKLMVDKCIETPLHFIEKNIDPSYCWNEWQLRKKAIQMANIRKTQTRADQTLLSNFRADSDTQTYLKADAETSTAKNLGTQWKAQKMDVGV